MERELEKSTNRQNLLRGGFTLEDKQFVIEMTRYLSKSDLTTCIFEIGRIQILLKKYKNSKKIYRLATMVENRVIFCKYYVHMCSVVKVPVYAKE